MNDTNGKPVIVYGATGFTGRLVADAMEWLGHPCIIAGRNEEKLKALAEKLPSKPEYRVADAMNPDSLKGLFEGASAVASTVGPFRKFGIPVVKAALEQGVHYADTTGEQTFQLKVRDNFHDQLVEKGLTFITGQAYEYAPGYLGAHLLNKRFGPISRLESFYLVKNGAASRGTKKSGLGMLSETFLTWHEGKLAPRYAPPRPLRVVLPHSEKTWHTIPFPGGDEVLVPQEIPGLQHFSTHLVLPPGPAKALSLLGSLRPLVKPLLNMGLSDFIEGKIDSGGDPTDEERAKAEWQVIVRSQGSKGPHHFRAWGADAYRITGDFCALGATWLAQGKGKTTGAVTSGTAFDAAEMLDKLKERGLEWEIK